jgi:hypothetical protein
MISMLKFYHLKRRFVNFLIIVLAIISLAGCQKPEIAFGTTFLNNNSTNIIVIDTFSVALSTVLADSIPTQSSGTQMIGNYQDPYFGNIESRSILQIGPPSSLPAVSFQATYDSLTFIMRSNRTFYGDTTIQQRYYVSQLDTVIALPVGQYAFYNNSKIPYNSNPLGYQDVTILPTAGLTTQDAFDTVKIKLPDTLGLHLMQMIQRRSDTITSLNSFLSYMKGFSIYTKPGTKGVVFGFKDTVTMRLHFHEPGAINNYKFIDFPFNNKSHQFNQITADRTGTPLQALVNAQSTRPNPLVFAEVPSSATANSSYVQSATGVQMKLMFPNLGTLTQLPDYLGILKAQLFIMPVPGSYSPLQPLPPQLILSQTDQNNKFGMPIIGPGGIESGNLIVDYTYGQNTLYTYDITTWLKELIASGLYNQEGLMLTAPSPANNTLMNRVVVYDRHNKIYTITLKLYYISLVH